jgi:hypothetical protein
MIFFSKLILYYDIYVCRITNRLVNLPILHLNGHFQWRQFKCTGYLLTDPHSVLNRWKNFFNQVLNVHGVHNIRQMYIHMAEQFVPESRLVEVETAIGNLKRYKSLGTDQDSS